MTKTKQDYVHNLHVLFEDNHMLVVEKYIDVLSQKDITEDIDMTEIIKEYLKQKYNKPGNVYVGLVHRLDRRVGGVMVFAKTSKAAKRISEDIRENRFDKTYLACVTGRLEKDGEIEVNIKKDEINKIAVISSSGKKALLRYQRLQTIKDKTFVKVALITGRYQQIRVSFAHIGHPLWHDYKYDENSQKSKEPLGLWCYKIGFIHPITKENLTFSLVPKGDLWKDLDKSKIM